MAIDAYTGLPRSGKSYSVVKNVIIPSLKEGRTVRTNIPLVSPLITDTFGGEVIQLASDWYSDNDLCDQFQPGEVIVLDELWRRWPAGLKANNANIKDKEFIAEHGHKVDSYGRTMRVVLVTQDLSQISAWARDLVDKTYRTTKLDAVGANSRFRIDIYQGCVTGQKPPEKQRLRQLFDKYESEYHQYYKSATHSETGEVGDESRADKRATIWKSPMLWTLAFIAIAGPVFGIWGLSRFFSPDADKYKPKVAQVVAPEPLPLVNPPPPGMDLGLAPKPEPVQPDQPAGPTLSAFWRVSGYVDFGKGQDGTNLKRQVLLSGEAGARRIVLFSDCNYYENGIDLYCDVDGFRVTPWTGRSAVTEVFQSTAGGKPAAVERSERSEQRPTTAGAAQPVSQSGPHVTGIPYTPAPRTLL